MTSDNNLYRGYTLCPTPWKAGSRFLVVPDIVQSWVPNFGKEINKGTLLLQQSLPKISEFRIAKVKKTENNHQR